MKKILFIIIGIFCSLMAFGGIILAISGDANQGGGIAGLVVAVIFAVVAYLFLKKAYMPKEQVLDSNGKNTRNRKGKTSSELAFLDNGYIVDRKVTAPSVCFAWELYVDGTSKKFAISTNKKKPETLQIFEFDKLLSFELQEDGATLSKGSAAKVVAGGLVFGGLGALAGVAAKKKNASTCESLVLRIHLNDLKNSLISFALLNKTVKKESSEYRTAKHTAEEILSLLAYIENNK